MLPPGRVFFLGRGAAGGVGPLPAVPRCSQPAPPLRPALSLQEMHVAALEVGLLRALVKAGAQQPAARLFFVVCWFFFWSYVVLGGGGRH